MMTLAAEKRDPEVKAKKLRREGYSTGVLYGREMKENVSLKYTEKDALNFIKKAKEGAQTMLDISGEKVDALVKNIDYDLDVKVSPTGKTTLLDEDEYQEHSAEMGYSQKLDKAIHHGLDRLMVDIRLQNSPFEHREISALYDKYLRYMDEDKRMK